ncbi:MAG: polymer-forming cytoskeletal protein, partial [Salinisphaeraceae bacterium]|nr:polymer-forming cytoskeletal protein [Salinisphaeraceae bacterium]
MSTANQYDSNPNMDKPGARQALIGPSIQLSGDLQGEEDLLVEGEFKGTITLKNCALTVGSQGKLKANVYAKTICVEGYMEGDMFASERVIIRRSAQVLGNITSPRVSLEDGAKLKGSVEMDPEALQGVFKAKGAAQEAKPAAQPADAKAAESKPAEAKSTESKAAEATNGSGKA